MMKESVAVMSDIRRRRVLRAVVGIHDNEPNIIINFQDHTNLPKRLNSKLRYRPKTSVTALSDGARIVGHIYGYQGTSKTAFRSVSVAGIHGEKLAMQQLTSRPLSWHVMGNHLLKTSRVSTSSNPSTLNPYSTSELVSDPRLSTSSYPIDSKSNRTNQTIHTRYNANTTTSHKKSERRNSPADELPAVVSPDDSFQTNIPVQPAQRRSYRTNHNKTWPAVQSRSPPADERQSILTISGIKNERQAEILRPSSDDEQGDTTPSSEQSANQKPPLPAASQSSIQTTVQSASSQQSSINSNNTNNNNTTNKSFTARHRNGYKPTLNGANKPVSLSRRKEDAEPKYADPISGSSSQFQSRLAEISSLEMETVRWERMKKLKKKTRSDD